jgi:hypothetical protein
MISSDTKGKYSMFVGDWRPIEEKNFDLIDKLLKEGKNILLCILDNENSEIPSDEVERSLKRKLWKQLGDGRVKIIQIPNIESIYIQSSTDYETVFKNQEEN